MEGTGDRLTVTPDVVTPPLVIVFPGVALSTKMMFEKLSFEKSKYCGEQSIKNMKDIWATHNAFESLACQQAPVIAGVLQSLRKTTGCRLARLSGSGSACFGVYETQDQAAVASRALKGQYPALWVWP
jgi:4-diphosphocytidyl-2-C-methyl-D-erythritol kinase